MRKLRILDPHDFHCELCDSFAIFAVEISLTAKFAKNCREERKAKIASVFEIAPRALGRQRLVWASTWLAVAVALSAPGFTQTTKQEVDLTVSGGIVVTMDGARTILHDGSVAVKGDAIVAVGPRGDIESRYKAAQM